MLAVLMQVYLHFSDTRKREKNQRDEMDGGRGRLNETVVQDCLRILPIVHGNRERCSNTEKRFK